MRSHTFEINWLVVCRELLWIFAILLLVATSLHSWRHVNPNARAAPEPLPVSTILAHQWEASTKDANIDTVLIGDSSCLMDVDTPLFSKRLATLEHTSVHALNQGTISFIPIESFASLINRTASTSGDRLKRVILLIHPEMLRNQSGSMNLSAESIYPDFNESDDSLRDRALHSLGFDLIEKAFLRRNVPIPLANQFGSFYGFQKGLDQYLSEHSGSAVEAKASYSPEAKKNPVFTPHLSVLQSSKEFRKKIPARLQLIVGLTPIPETYPGPNYKEDYKRMLHSWSLALEADAKLEGLPPTLPEAFFSTSTHLNNSGQRAYSRWLADQIFSVTQKSGANSSAP